MKFRFRNEGGVLVSAFFSGEDGSTTAGKICSEGLKSVLGPRRDDPDGVSRISGHETLLRCDCLEVETFRVAPSLLPLLWICQDDDPDLDMYGRRYLGGSRPP